jgi:integrase
MMTGLRIRNLAGLEIGRTLVLQPGGGVGISIPANEVKNRVALAMELPPDSAALVRRYIDTARPRLGDPTSAYLFPGSRLGTPKTMQALRTQISKAMAHEAGVAWHPHLFRHLIAKLVLDDDPGADALVTRSLGQKKGSETARIYYSGYQTAAASRQVDSLVVGHRAKLRKPGRGQA